MSDQSETLSTPSLRRRLRREYPELYARVTCGELSPYAAAVEAGIKPRMRSVPITTAETAIRALCRWFDPNDLRAALDATEDKRAEAVEHAMQAIADAREVMDHDPEAEP